MLISNERYSPGSFDLCTGYEHIHRYLIAAQYAQGKKVLDLACGEGYGTALLAKSASDVIGVDISSDAIAHAKTAYQAKNLSFLVGAMEQIPLHDLFDVIVCFEAIEHMQDHELLCQGIKRLLHPNGLFIVSTPNKWVYSGNGKTQNPYHLKELDLAELKSLLGRYFQHARIYGQKAVTASRVFPLDSPSKAIDEKRIQMSASGFCTTNQEDPLPRYFIALASDQKLEPRENISYLTDVAARQGFAQWIEREQSSKSMLKAIIKRWLGPLLQ